MSKKYVRQTKKACEELVLKLIEEYGEPASSLDFDSPFSLVVGLILAAQCTDERVNKTTPILWEKYKTIEGFANADLKELEILVKPCGFYRNKALSIKESARIVIENFNGEVPKTMKELTTLRGIGRKSANIILQDCFGVIDGIAVDTHVTRLTRKMGISNGNGPIEIENDLMKKLDKKYWNKVNMLMVTHGRAICIANAPKCEECIVKNICKKND